MIAMSQRLDGHKVKQQLRIIKNHHQWHDEDDWTEQEMKLYDTLLTRKNTKLPEYY
jgi:hypothetical protein